MALGGIPIARDQIEHHHPACGQLALLARAPPARLFRRPRALPGVAVPVEKLRVGQLGVHAAGLGRALQVIARFGGVAFAFHLPGVGCEIVGARATPMQHKDKYQEEK